MQPNNTQLSDTKLLSLMKAGNQLAFQTLYNKYWNKLYTYTFNILNDKWLTEDVLHEVFTNIWIKRESLEIKALKNYLFNAVRNNALLKIRDYKFISLDERIISELNHHTNLILNLDEVDLKSKINTSVNKLPKRCRSIFYMSKFEHYSNIEIAKHFNISKRTVDNQLSLALKHLRSDLGNVIYSIILFFFL